MILAIITIFFVIAIAYRKEVLSLKDAQRSFFYRYRKLLLLLGVTIIPVVTLNVIDIPEREFTPAEEVEDAEKNGTATDIITAHFYNVMAYPDSLPLYFDFVDAMRSEATSECRDIDFTDFTSDKRILRIANEYAHFACEEYTVDAALLDHSSYDYINTPYVNYVRGVQKFNQNNIEQAERYFLQEVKLNPVFDNTYLFLYKIYDRYKPEQLDPFLLNPENAKHLPNDLLNFEYFRMGSYGNYLYTIFVERFLDITFMAFFAGLIISIIWLIYLRSMDIFNKDSWVDIILVFIGGILFTHLCLPLYDYAHYQLNLGINGHFINDFLYCTFVIGGSEEIVKLIPWVIFALATKKMKEPYDYILYASVAALGFAFAENWMYLEHSQNIVIRFIMSTVAHMFFASVVAYSVILAKYKFKKKSWKILSPIIGFGVAIFSHGFYDFWLISPSTRGFSIITTLFLILTIHIWFYLKNNATNNSKFYVSKPFNVNYQVDLFMIGVVGILMLEFVLMSIQYNVRIANSFLKRDAWMICAFLLYMTVILRNYKPVKGLWMRYRLPKIPVFANMAGKFFSLPNAYEFNQFESDHVGLKLRLFTAKSNPYIGTYMPKSGVCVEVLEISDTPGWYLFKFNKPMNYSNYDPWHVIVKPKSNSNSLTDDKIEIYLMLIPQGVRLQSKLETNNLRYTGKAYSRPL